MAYGPVARTNGGVVAQVQRGGHGRQAQLSRALPGLDVVPIDEALGRRAGMLLGRAGEQDAIDAAVVLLARDGDTVPTSDPADLRSLAHAAAIHIDLVKA